MNRQYQLVVFDWEGTLAEDPVGHVLHILEREALRLHVGDFDKMLAYSCVPLGIAGMIKKLFSQLPMYNQQQLFESVQAAIATSVNDVCLNLGAEELVKRIQASGIQLAIATNRGLQSLQRVMAITGMDAYFKVFRTASQAPAKPCPQMLEEILDECGVDAAKTLMIGDSVSDMEMAVSIHVDAIALDLFQGQEEALKEAGALHVFDNFQQIEQYIFR